MTDPIAIHNLTKDFDGFRAVDSLSLSVKKGRFIGFLGPNGAGKTTTIKILTNLLDATDGSAYLNGVDVTKEPKAALAEVGAVVETPEFYPYLTPKETLSYLGSIRGMSEDEIKRRSVKVLDIVKMSEWADQRIGKFSKGMKQRVALAQAILHEPTILILDEPTSGLDPRGMVEVRDILRDLKKDGYTIFMSSHLLNEVQEVCDEIALIDHGRMLKQGSVESLIGALDYRKLELRVLEAIDEQWTSKLSMLQGVTDVKALGNGNATMFFTGSDEGQAKLLLDIQSLGLHVVSLKESGLALESLYLTLIKESR